MQDRVLILDGLNQAFRSFITPKSKNNSSSDEESSEDNFMIFVFLRSLRALVEKFQPTRCFFTLEGKPQFRYDLYPAYKANRIIKTSSSSKMESFHRQKKIIIEILSKLPITIAKAPNYEADDLIYTLSYLMKDEKIIIVSNDSDFIQLLQDYSKFDVQLYNPIKKIFVECPKEYNYLVWKSIAGDVSDNIPAVASKAKASQIAASPLLLKAFLSNEENRANFSLNQKLITMKLLGNNDIELNSGSLDKEFLRLKFQELKLNSFFKNNYFDKFIDTFSSMSC